MNIDRFNNPTRFDQIARLHANAFAWRRQDWIPLGIHVVDPSGAAGLDYASWLNPEPFFDYQCQILEDTLSVGSDLMPGVAINHMGDGILPTMFGAELHIPKDGSATLQDVGPTPLPVFDSIEDAVAFGIPPTDAGNLPQVERFMLCYRERLPEWVTVVAPMPEGPFSLAMELRGTDILTDMIEKPELAKQFIVNCGIAIAEVELHLRKLVGTRLDQHISNFLVMGTGLRLGEDSMVNLSPEMIREFVVPGIVVVNEILGGEGHIHFCSLPHSRFEHIFPALAGVEDVAVVSTQMGFEYYQNHLNDLRGRLAVESFYGDGLAYVKQEYGSFKDWAFDFVPKIKQESGLVLYCTVSSVEEAQDMWATWQQAHEK